MSSNFAMNMDAVNESGSNITKSGENVGVTISSFEGHVGTIDADWTGADADAFQAAADRLNRDLKEAQEFVNHVGSHLTATGAAVETTVSDNVNNINKVMDQH